LGGSCGEPAERLFVVDLYFVPVQIAGAKHTLGDATTGLCFATHFAEIQGHCQKILSGKAVPDVLAAIRKFVDSSPRHSAIHLGQEIPLN
jgi:hypothetical protein